MQSIKRQSCNLHFLDLKYDAWTNNESSLSTDISANVINHIYLPYYVLQIDPYCQTQGLTNFPSLASGFQLKEPNLLNRESSLWILKSHL